MAHPYHLPVAMPRFSNEEFEKKRAAYVAEHGYQVHIPQFDEIIKWYVIPEPSNFEMAYYRKKDITRLGEKRYFDIHFLITEKRLAYERILSSPSPAWIRNASSALTFIDDINDALGTFGVLLRTIGRALPASLSKFVMGPAGWLFLAADITNIAMTLSRLPWKTRRLQHELHYTLKYHPFSARARRKRWEKVYKTKLTKGELIEALQTTDNIFGYGLCLGPIMGLLYDIPSGLYHHIKGEQVTITGLPESLLWFDRIWSNALKSLAELFYGSPPIVDEQLDKAAVAMHYCTIAMQSAQRNLAALDLLPDAYEIEVFPRGPEYPSTREVIREYGNDPDKQLGYPSTDTFYKNATAHWEQHREDILDGVKRWMDRGRYSTQTMIAAQNAVAAGQVALANLYGEDAIEWEYDPVTATLLKLYNQGYTFPQTVHVDDAQAWASHITKLAMSDGTVDVRTALDVATYEHHFSFTTEIPERPPISATIPVSSHKHPIEKLRLYFAGQIRILTIWLQTRGPADAPERAAAAPALIAKYREWLDRYGYPEGWE